ncbi:hypothetical protein EDEG_00917 [Edhazardia aedis USNM 41457]|uniref:L-type lectin-like domain-containing protein n=1 Tax=Edhazardia aedis (strain USNM 41457) TaxID=1003232 RepID=J9DQZ6_EDHAE|nr:hypothetical protein EDEG_00917 [Edhazardia aedis USNM 41457]|eukprot:EJW05000.1 hypothetical protein EDEG_00917 [Edhazardia aedis USNM 41457]
MLLFYNFALGSIVETLSKEYDRENIFDQPTKQMSNVTKLDDEYVLRSFEKPGSSMITFSDTNPYDEWSFVAKFRRPETVFPEKASFHIWYTDKNLEDGSFYGSAGAFIGLMAGMEFQGDYTTLLLSINTNNEDFEKDPYVNVLKDEIPKILMKDIEEITMKVIFTSQNFKIELLHDDEVFYDHLRFYDISKLKHLEKNMHFSVSAQYQGLAVDKNISLESVKLYERKESAEYDRFARSAKVEIDKEDNEIHRAISALEYFMNYIHIVFGSRAQGTTILQGIDNALHELSRGFYKLTSVRNRLTTAKKNVSLGDLPAKLAILDVKVANLSRSVGELEYILHDFEKSHLNGMNKVWYIIIGVSVSLMAYLFLVDGKKTKEE